MLVVVEVRNGRGMRRSGERCKWRGGDGAKRLSEAKRLTLKALRGWVM